MGLRKGANFKQNADKAAKQISTIWSHMTKIAWNAAMAANDILLVLTRASWVSHQLSEHYPTSARAA